MYADREFVNDNGDMVEEYVKKGKTTVYINNKLTQKTFNQVLNEWTNQPSISKDE